MPCQKGLVNLFYNLSFYLRDMRFLITSQIRCFIYSFSRYLIWLLLVKRFSLYQGLAVQHENVQCDERRRKAANGALEREPEMIGFVGKRGHWERDSVEEVVG